MKLHIIAIFVLATVLFSIGFASAAECGEGIKTCDCGDTLMTSYELSSSDPITVNTCSGDGLIIGVSGTEESPIVLDCKNKQVTGSNEAKGIKILTQNYIEIMNCNVVSFDQNILLNGNWLKVKDSTVEYGKRGIFLYGATNNVLDNIYVKDNADGVSFYQSAYNMLKNSEFYSNHGNTIYLIVDSDENTIINNWFRAGSDVKKQIFIDTLSGNVPENNRIYNNHFEDEKVEDDTGVNYWYSEDNAGNLWDTYTGEDTDHDGYGNTNTPYPAEGLDSYPVVQGCTSECSTNKCSGDDIKECKEYPNGCSYLVEEAKNCEAGCSSDNGDAYCNVIIDCITKPFCRSNGYGGQGSRGGSKTYSPLASFDVEAFETPIYVSYKYMYYAWTNGGVAHLYSEIFDGESEITIDDNDFTAPYTGDRNERYDVSLYAQKDIQINDPAELLNFDFKNGDYKIIVTDLVIWGRDTDKGCNDRCDPTDGTYITTQAPWYSNEVYQYPRKCDNFLGDDYSWQCVMDSDTGCYDIVETKCDAECNEYNGLCEKYTVSEEEDQSCSLVTATVSTYNKDTTWGRRELAQPFITEKEHITRVSLDLSAKWWYKNTPRLTVEIQTDNSGKPSGTAIATSKPLPLNEIIYTHYPSSHMIGQWTDFELKADVDPGEKYWIVLKDNSNRYAYYAVWRHNEYTDKNIKYPCGNDMAVYRSSPSSSWESIPYNRFFETYGY
jgi:parallel beta-helix repeat protein